MREFQVKSKVYCPPSKTEKVIYILVNISVVFMVIYSIGSILTKGFNLNNVSGCIIAIAVGGGFNAKHSNEGHYEFSVLSLSFIEDVLKIGYSTKTDKKIEVDLTSIRSLEYSDQLECLRLVCDYKEWEKGQKEEKEKSELLLYIKYESNQDFYQTLQEITGKNLYFVDR